MMDSLPPTLFLDEQGHICHDPEKQTDPDAIAVGVKLEEFNKKFRDVMRQVMERVPYSEVTSIERLMNLLEMAYVLKGPDMGLLIGMINLGRARGEIPIEMIQNKDVQDILVG